jgi:ATP-dependent exoDNAse (exonuclease V) beta subunit
MNGKLFSIYRSSAGSGKTRTLAKEYLKLALHFRTDYYRHILAVTFTNKATQEMKSRILVYLDTFAKGRTDELALELMQELDIDAQSFQQRAQEVQCLLLHRYSDFVVSTIDSFFQKVIRSFTREAGLSGDFRLEINQEEVLEQVIENLIDELGTNKELTNWVIAFATENLENDRAWDVRSTLIDFAHEIFREEFRIIEDQVLQATADSNYFKNLSHSLRQKRFSFMSAIKKTAAECLRLIHENGWSAQDFKYNGGAYNSLVKLSNLSSVVNIDEESIGKRLRREYTDAHNWGSDKSAFKNAIDALAEKTLIPKLNELLNYRDKNFQEALSAEVVLSNFYAFGLLTDISRKLREFKEENNIMLLADAPKFLNGIIQDSDTPFIYEKVGSFYRNYLIDEFQDTSGFQWKNFKPLLTNSLDQGYPCVIVGDVKQSIYRWRGGDLKLLQEEVEQQIGKDRVVMKSLDSNFRSASVIVDFNNSFFKETIPLLQNIAGRELIGSSYADVAQKKRLSAEGIVTVQFLQSKGTDENWKEQAKAALVREMEELQDKGIKLSDMAMLVRKNEEGQEIADYLLTYKNSHPESTYRYDVVSSESLRLDGAIAVNLLVSTLTYLLNPDDLVARAQLAYDHHRLQKKDREWHGVFSVTDKNTFEESLPQAFVKGKNFLRKLSLLELTETLIEIFSLGRVEGEAVYLQAFQELVLEFNSRQKNDTPEFLTWWKDNKDKKSIQASGTVNAAQIYTIHKSKGLQFKYVIIPFCNWELDHLPIKAPLLWVEAKEPPFDGPAHVPIKYQEALSSTIFKEAYEEEKTRACLDNINLLYVALTRAELGLCITAPHPESLRQKNSIASVLYKTLTGTDSFSSFWDSANSQWKRGVIVEHAPAITKPGDDSIVLRRYSSTQWRNKLILRQQSGNFFRGRMPLKEDGKIKGVKFHAIFSKIDFATNRDKALQRSVAEGLIQTNEIAEFKSMFDALMQNDIVASWFSPPWNVKTEAVILLPGKNEKRVDRIMVNKNKAIVVDYKTGTPKAADQVQVKEYMTVLSRMGFTLTEGFLLYLMDNTVQQVFVSNAHKKDDKDQLALGI